MTGEGERGKEGPKKRLPIEEWRADNQPMAERIGEWEEERIDG